MMLMLLILLLYLVYMLAAVTSAWSPVLSPSSSQISFSSSSRTLMMASKEDYDDDETTTKHTGYNVLGAKLTCCCANVGGSGIGTGFFRNGYCATGDLDMGRHTVCMSATEEFLAYSRLVGNDLSTPMPEYHFPGLKEGDIWCLCAQRWAQAYNAGKAPKLYLQATHEKTLDYVPLEILKLFAIDGEESRTVEDKLNLQRNQLNELISQRNVSDGDSFQ